MRVGAELAAGDNAGGNGEDILDGAAELDADEIIGPIKAHGVGCEAEGDFLADGFVRARRR